MNDRSAQLRSALMRVFAALDESPTALARVREHLAPVVDALFSGQDVSSSLLGLSMHGALMAYWSAATSGADGPLLLGRLEGLYSAILDDPTRVSALDAQFEREVAAPRVLVASPSPPPRYVLVTGAVALAQDPDPKPERDLDDALTDEENSAESAGADDAAGVDENAPTNDSSFEQERSEGSAASANHAGSREDASTSGNAPSADDQAKGEDVSTDRNALRARKPSNDARADDLPPLEASFGQVPPNAEAANQSQPYTLEEGAKKPLPLYRFYRDLAYSAFDTMALIAQHRTHRQLAESLDEEEWILQLGDAVASVGLEALTAARRYFVEHADAEPHALWGPAYFLGCVEGRPAARLLDELVGMLTQAPPSASAAITDAIADSTSPELEALTSDWLVSPVATKRAVSSAVRCRQQSIGSRAAERALNDPSRAVRLLTLEGLRDLDVGSPELARELESALVSQWHSGDAEIAWQAVLTSTWLGLGGAYRAFRRGELRGLGGYELDFIVLVGDAEDLPRVRTLIESSELNARTLRLLARFGHPAVIPVLIHGLKDEELQNDAADALEVLLGPQLDADARLDPNAWQQRIPTLPLRADTRFWLGQPYRPSSFLQELERGQCSLIELERYLEEIRVRTGHRFPTALHGWSPKLNGRFGLIQEEVRRADRLYAAGQWHCALVVAE